MIDSPHQPQPPALSKLDELEVQILLKEYEALASSIRVNIERLDRIIGLYSAAISAVIAFFLTRADIQAFLANITSSTELTVLVLVIPAINCILLMHAVSTFQCILVQARCATYIIGERLRTITQRNVLLFDQLDDIDKRAWLRQRYLIGTSYCALSMAVSITILMRFSHVINSGGAFVSKLVWLVSLAMVSISIGHLVRHPRVNRYFAVLHRTDADEPIGLWVIATACFFALLICAML